MSSSYRQIFKSTSIIGGASLITTLIGMISVKFVAEFLGKEGVGVIGLYTGLVGIVATITGLGLSNSGVRQIADAFGRNDNDAMAKTVTVFRRTVWVTGLVGTIAMVLLARPLARWTFDSPEYAVGIAVLGAVILINAVSDGQGCLIQGMRRIGDLSRMRVLGSVIGTPLAVGCYYCWGIAGIVPGLILAALSRLMISWYYARQVKLLPVALNGREYWSELRGLAGLGISFMLFGLINTSCAYLQRIILVQEFGIEACGVYLASYSLSGVLIGFILGAMGTDYYPRLVGLIHDREKLNAAVNEQQETSLLLAFPGLLGMMIFAQLAIYIFYSKAFSESVLLLQILVFGMFGRVFSWPLGFLPLAHADGTILVVFETIANAVYLGFFWVGMKQFGLPGAAAAFGLLYIFHAMLTLLLARFKYRVAVSPKNFRLALGMSLVMMMVFVNLRFNPFLYLNYGVSAVIFGFSSWFCARILLERLGLPMSQLKNKVYSYVTRR